MTSFDSPKVVTDEIALATIAPRISGTIAGIVGAARKGRLNKPGFSSSPDSMVEAWGSPLLEDYGLQALTIFHQDADKAWFSRIGSLRGNDPVATANTDDRAALEQTDATAFTVPTDIQVLADKRLRLRFDSESSKDITIIFSAAVIASLVRSTLTETMNALSEWINSVLSANYTLEPRYGYTTVVEITGGKQKLKFWSELKSGLSRIEVLTPAAGTDAASDFGWTSGVTVVNGSRNIVLVQSLTAAQILSAVQGAGYDLGTAAVMTGANTGPFNLGEPAEALLNNSENSGVAYNPTTYSFVAGVKGNTLLEINTLSSLFLANLQAAPYGIDPNVTLYIDGYEVTFSIPLTSWIAGAITAANIQDFVDAANAAAPTGLGNFMFVDPTDNSVTIQSPGKSIGYTYIKFPFPQVDSPTGNSASASLAMWMLGFKMWDVKVQNQFQITTDSASDTISFDAATLATYGYHPSAMTAAQVVNVLNQEWGSTIAAIDSGLRIKLTGDYNGLDAFVRAEDYNSDRESMSGNYTYTAANWFRPDTTPNNLDGMELDAVNNNEVYLRFNFGTGNDYGIVRVKNVASLNAPAPIVPGDIDLISTSLDVDVAGKTAFEAALAAVLVGCVLDAPGSGLAVGQVTVGAIGGFTAGLKLDIYRAAVDTGGDVDLVFAGATIAGVPTPPNPTPEDDVVSFQYLNNVTTVQAGDTLQDAAVPAVQLTVTRVYNHGDLILYIDNSGPLQITDVGATVHNVTNIVDTSSSVGWVRRNSRHADLYAVAGGGPTDTFTIAAGTIATAGAPVNIDVPAGSNNWICWMKVGFLIGAVTHYAIIGVVPTGTSWLGTSLLVSDSLGPLECPVDIITLVQANGVNVVAGAGSWAYLDTNPGGGVYRLELSLTTLTVSGNPATEVVHGEVIGHDSINYAMTAATQMPGAAYGPWSTGVATANANYRRSYNPNTATFYDSARSMLSKDDWGEGWAKFTFTVDDLWTVDIDFNDYAFTSQSAATIAEVVDAVNAKARAVDASLDGIASASTGMLRITSATKGSSSKLRTIVDNVALDFSLYTGAAQTGSGSPLFAFTVDGDAYSINFSDYAGTAIIDQSAATAAEVVDALQRETGLGSLISVVGTGAASQVKIVSSQTGASAAIVVTTPNIDLGGDFGLAATYNGTETDAECGTAYAVSPGTWANAAEGNVKIQFEDTDPLFFAPNTSKITIYVNGEAVASYNEVSPDPDADGTTGPTGEGTFIEDVLGTETDADDGTNPNPWIVFEFDEDLATTEQEYTGGKFKEATYSLSGGANGIDGLSVDDYIGVGYDSTYDGPTGLQVFSDKNAYFVNHLSVPGLSDTSLYNALVSIATDRKDAIFAFDPPFGLQPLQILDWHNGRGGYGNTKALTSSYGYLPGSTWMRYRDTYNKQDIWLPPGAFTPGLFAASDATSEQWFAPAGLKRGVFELADDVQYSPDMGTRDLLYAEGQSVNPIVDMDSAGILLFGEKTFERLNVMTNRIHVRRLMCYLNRVVELGSMVYLFDPNDKVARDELVDGLENIMSDVMKRRGVVRFKVKDATTNFHIQNKRMRILIFLEPQTATEIIEVPFIIAQAGQAFSETGI